MDITQLAESEIVGNTLLNTSIEIINPDLPCGGIRSALFDFDGTLSLIRQGWQDVMIPMLADT